MWQVRKMTLAAERESGQIEGRETRNTISAVMVESNKDLNQAEH